MGGTSTRHGLPTARVVPPHRRTSVARLALAALLTMALAAVTAVAGGVPTASAVPVDLSEVAARVSPSVVRVDTTIDYQHAIGAGTGIILDPGGAVMTNFHVVQGADTISASVDGRPFPADLLGYDRGQDIAVIQLRGAGALVPAALGDTGRLAVGDPVVALGNAGGSGNPLTQEAGNVVGFDRTISAKDELTGSSDQMTGLFEFAAPVRPGDSGGPVVDADGQVVGVTTAASVNFRMGAGGAGFAIPINVALPIANQIRSQSPTASVHIGRPTLLGVGVSAREQQRGLPGVILHEVLAGGAAQAAGLVTGDVLLSIDGAPVNSPTELTDVLDRHYPGDVVTLVWIDRDGQRLEAKATLTA